MTTPLTPDQSSPEAKRQSLPEAGAYDAQVTWLSENAKNLNLMQLQHLINNDLLEQIAQDVEEGEIYSQFPNPDTDEIVTKVYTLDDIFNAEDGQMKLALKAKDDQDVNWARKLPRINGLRSAIAAIGNNPRLSEALQLAVMSRQAQILDQQAARRKPVEVSSPVEAAKLIIGIEEEVDAHSADLAQDVESKSPESEALLLEAQEDLGEVSTPQVVEAPIQEEPTEVELTDEQKEQARKQYVEDIVHFKQGFMTELAAAHEMLSQNGNGPDMLNKLVDGLQKELPDILETIRTTPDIAKFAGIAAGIANRLGLHQRGLSNFENSTVRDSLRGLSKVVDTLNKGTQDAASLDAGYNALGAQPVAEGESASSFAYNARNEVSEQLTYARSVMNKMGGFSEESATNLSLVMRELFNPRPDSRQYVTTKLEALRASIAANRQGVLSPNNAEAAASINSVTERIATFVAQRP